MSDEDLLYVPKDTDLTKIYMKSLENRPVPKNTTRADPTVTFPNKERTVCVLTSSYILRLGMFKKEKRAIFTLNLNMAADKGAYSGRISESRISVVEEQRGTLTEILGGRMEEAKTPEISSIVELYKQDMFGLKSALLEF